MSTIGIRIPTAARALRVALGLCLALAVGSGCKQGEGEVCQIESDCEDGLTCSAGSNRCVSAGGDNTPENPDAAPASDAAPPADAPPAPLVDATPQPDLDAGAELDALDGPDASAAADPDASL